MARPSRHEYYLQMLALVASRGTCARRQVAAILTDTEGRILATGYNGPPSGYPHCITTPCLGALDPAGYTSRCVAIHAEQNAIVQAGLSGNLARAAVLYCSASPCLACCKLLCSLSQLRDVYCLERYADATGLELLRGRQILTRLRVKEDVYVELKGELP